MQNTPISVVGVTRKVDLTVLKLLHDVDIVLGMNWIEWGNPLIELCAGKMYLPISVHTAHLSGSWLDHQHKTVTVKTTSTHEGLKEIKNEAMRNQLAIIKSPKFWFAVSTKNSWTNSSKGEVKDAGNKDAGHKIGDSELFVQNGLNFGPLYI